MSVKTNEQALNEITDERLQAMVLGIRLKMDEQFGAGRVAGWIYGNQDMAQEFAKLTYLTIRNELAGMR